MKQLKILPTVTDRTKSLEEYLHDISRLEMVSPEEETDLASRIQAGDDAAFKRLVEANLRFVISVAKQYQNCGLDLMDLINEGNIGLMKAALKFDPTRGFKFISYAVWWIRQQIIQALSEQVRTIRLPLNQVMVINKIARARSSFLQDNEREPTDAELAEMLDISPWKLSDAEVSTLSLDYPIGEDDQSLKDIIPDSSLPEVDSALEGESLRKELALAMMVLNTRERDVLELAFGLGCQPLSLDEIGMKMDLTRERVRQLKMKALHKLSSPAVRSRLVKYL